MTTPFAFTRALFFAAIFVFGITLMAEEDPSLTRPDKGRLDPQELPQGPRFLIPDAAHDLKEMLSLKDSAFTMKMSLISIVDYTAFSQDATNVSQVGRMKDEFDVRAARLIVRGTIGGDKKLRYFIATEFNGFDPDHTNLFTLVDANLAYPVFTPSTLLTVGKMKETFIYEMVGDAANLAQQERILNPFFVSRNVGVKLTHVGFDEHMTFSGGVFNDSWVSGAWDGAATDVTARVTGVLGDPRGDQYLHLGASMRRVGAGDDTLRYRGKPETNVGVNFVDTGKFTGDHAWNYGLEALWNTGPVSLLFEQVWSFVDGPGSPVFSGDYLTASWFLTGDHRPYDPTVGYARRVLPESKWGALELVARVSQVDLNDGGFDGGHMKRVYAGLNWWATQRWKIGVGWGHTWLDRKGSTGESDSILTRLQWVF